jgi:hypothetical protein
MEITAHSLSHAKLPKPPTLHSKASFLASSSLPFQSSSKSFFAHASQAQSPPTHVADRWLLEPVGQSALSLSLSLSLSPRITVKDWYIELLTKKGEDGCVVLKIVILVKMQQKSRDKYNIYIYIFYHSNVNCSWPLFWSQFERLWNPSGSYAYWIWEMLLSRTGMMLNWTPAISFFFFLQAHDEPKVDFDCQLYDNRISIY